MAYTQRYGGGFGDGNPATPVDSQYLNAVEAALLKLYGLDPSADGQALLWKAANTRFEPALIKDANVDPAAAISKSKLGALGIVNADVAANAAINASKLAGYPGDVKTFLRGDGGWQKGGMNLLWDSVDAGVALPVASMTTSALDQSFKHLLVVISARSDRAALLDGIGMRINGLTAANYFIQTLRANNTTASAFAQAAGTAFDLGVCAAASSNATSFGSNFVLLPDYANATKGQKFLNFNVHLADGTASNFDLRLTGGWYSGAAAVSTLTFFPTAGGLNLVAGSRISVYGV